MERAEIRLGWKGLSGGGDWFRWGVFAVSEDGPAADEESSGDGGYGAIGAGFVATLELDMDVLHPAWTADTELGDFD